MKETELAAMVIIHLQARGWKTYQEVQQVMYGPRADIIGVRGKLVCAVECKRRMGLQLIGQAMGWRFYTHLVWVATTARDRFNKDRQSGSINAGEFAAEKLLKQEGIGALEYSGDDHVMRECFIPRLNRKPYGVDSLRGLLHEGMNAYAAGNADGARWTPFRETCENLKRLALEEPGIPLLEAVGRIDHHYARDSTARRSLRKWIDEGKVPGVELRLEGRRLAVYSSKERGT